MPVIVVAWCARHILAALRVRQGSCEGAYIRTQERGGGATGASVGHVYMHHAVDGAPAQQRRHRADHLGLRRQLGKHQRRHELTMRVCERRRAVETNQGQLVRNIDHVSTIWDRGTLRLPLCRGRLAQWHPCQHHTRGRHGRNRGVEHSGLELGKFVVGKV